MEASNPNTENSTDPHSKYKVIRAQPINRDEGYVKDNSDIRERCENTSKFPYSVHGVFFFDINSTRYFGTGIMIGPKTVLTAGHNLYDRETKADANLKRMQFVPGMNGPKYTFLPVKVEKYFVSEKYIAEGKEDYGILILEESIGDEIGFFHLSDKSPEDLENKVISIFGYPGDKVQFKPKTYELWGGSLQVGSIKEGFIYYAIDTAPGQSGSGVFYQEGNEFYICGIHVHGSLTINRGTLLTKTIREQIYAWQSESQESKKEDVPEQAEQDFWNAEIDPETDVSQFEFSKFQDQRD